jgi:hypothetical protein
MILERVEKMYIWEFFLLFGFLISLVFLDVSRRKKKSDSVFWKIIFIVSCILPIVFLPSVLSIILEYYTGISIYNLFFNL